MIIQLCCVLDGLECFKCKEPLLCPAHTKHEVVSKCSQCSATICGKCYMNLNIVQDCCPTLVEWTNGSRHGDRWTNGVRHGK